MQPAMLQCLLGLRCNEFTMLAADQITTQNIFVLKDDSDKLIPISDHLILGINGDVGDTTQFSQFIEKNIQLYKIRNGYKLGPEAAVHHIRTNLADSLRSGSPYYLNTLLAGYDKEKGGILYYMDYLATCVSVPFAAHGYGGMFSVSLLDNFYQPTLTESEAYEIIKMCVQEIQQRLFLNLTNFEVKVVSGTGIRTLPIINTATFLAE